MWRTVLGVLFIALIGNGYDLLGLGPLYEQITLDVILLTAVATDAWARRRRGRPAPRVSRAPALGSPRGMTPERQDPEDRDDLDQVDELVDEFGDRSGPDPAREPELELGKEETIVEPTRDDKEDE